MHCEQEAATGLDQEALFLLADAQRQCGHLRAAHTTMRELLASGIRVERVYRLAVTIEAAMGRNTD